MSFLTELESVATDLVAEGHSLASKASGLFGTAKRVVEGIVSELTPALEQLKADVAGQVADLIAEGTADVKADIAEIKALLAGATATAPADAPDVAPAGPAAPATDVTAS
jgi:hypothetical protein